MKALYPSQIIKRLLKIISQLSEISKKNILKEREENIIANVFSHSRDGASPELKLKIYYALKLLKRRRKKPFGMIIVLGWRREWNKKFASFPDSSQNLFAAKPFDFKGENLERCVEILAKTADFDGAILMNAAGEIIASGAYLENMNPKKIANIINPVKAKDLSEAFGFAKKVHTRHLAAISASYKLKSTTVFVVSEEDGSIRIFEDGKIIFSTISKEVWKS